MFTIWYANYSISKDPVYLTLTKSYKVTAVDANNYNSVPGTYYTEALKDYDTVVASESVASTNKFGIALADLIGKVPMLNLKAFYYGNSSWNPRRPPIRRQELLDGIDCSRCI